MDRSQLSAGVPIRFPSHAILCVDSADSEMYDKATGMRRSAYNAADVQINNQRPLLAGYMNRIGLTEVNMQWNIPNVNSTNNTFTVGLWDLSGGPTQELLKVVRVTIPSDFYPLPAIMNRLVDQLNADASGNDLPTPLGFVWDAQVDATLAGTGAGVKIGTANSIRECVDPRVRLYLSASGSGTGRFSIIPYNATSVYGTSASVGLPTLTDDLTNMLGLTPTIGSGSSNAYYAEVTGGYASAQYTPYVDIESNFLTKNQNVNDGSTSKQTTASKIARVYISNESVVSREYGIKYNSSGNYESSYDNALGTSAFVLNREFKNPKIMNWNNTENVDIVDLQVIDYRGNKLPVDQIVTIPGFAATFNSTADFQFTIQATEQ